MSPQPGGMLPRPAPARRARSAPARTAATLLAVLLLAGGLPGAVPAALAASPDCPLFFDLYRGCHERGQRADGSLSCLRASRDAMSRVMAGVLAGAQARSPRKSLQGAQLLVELVCATGCEDAVALRAPATRPEVAEAFCD